MTFGALALGLGIAFASALGPRCAFAMVPPGIAAVFCLRETGLLELYYCASAYGRGGDNESRAADVSETMIEGKRVVW